MNNLINDILSLSRIKDGKLTPKYITTDIGKLASLSVDLYNNIAIKKGITLTNEIPFETYFHVDEKLIFERVNKHGKCLVLTEEPYNNSFAQALSGRIQENCFKNLDAPVYVMGSENLPAIPLNSTLEATMLPNAEKVSEKIEKILAY